MRRCLGSVVFEILQAYKELLDNGSHVTLQWVSGHAGIPGNKEADRAVLNAHQRASSHPIVFTSGDRQIFNSTSATEKMKTQRTLVLIPCCMLSLTPLSS